MEVCGKFGIRIYASHFFSFGGCSIISIGIYDAGRAFVKSTILFAISRTAFLPKISCSASYLMIRVSGRHVLGLKVISGQLYRGIIHFPATSALHCAMRLKRASHTARSTMSVVMSSFRKISCPGLIGPRFNTLPSNSTDDHFLELSIINFPDKYCLALFLSHHLDSSAR